MAQGRTDAAASAALRLLGETGDVVRRSKVGCTALLAQAASCRAAVARADRDVISALPELRAAWRHWYALGARYEAARTRVELGGACLSAGDEDSGRMELEAAMIGLAEIGTAPLLARADALLRPRGPDGLTAWVDGLNELQIRARRTGAPSPAP